MSLDSETRVALAEELEDVAMELANISQMLPTTVATSEKENLTHSLHAIETEIERLGDLAELYEYEELIPIARWVHQNVVALDANTKQFVKNSEAGLFSIWVELLAASLQQQDDELSAELEMTLLDSDWHSEVDQQQLQTLLDSLLISSLDSTSTAVASDDEISSQSSESQSSENQSSSYRLAPDDDIHPELLEAFFIETPDQVIEVAELIRTISNGNGNKQTHQTAARIAHTIKGSSAVAGIEAVASLAHKLEDILEYSVERLLPPEVSDLLIESSDCLEAMFDSLLTQSFPPQHYPQLLEQLTQWDKKFSTGYIYKPAKPVDLTESIETATKDDIKVQEPAYRLAPDDDVHPELLEAFFIETPDQVIVVAELIRTISLGGSDKTTHQEAARIAHTIKGSSAVVGIDAVASLAHKLEDILEYSIEQPLPPEVANLLVESSDCLEAMFDSLLMQSSPPPQYPSLLEQLTHWDKKFSRGYIYQPPITDNPPISKDTKKSPENVSNIEVSSTKKKSEDENYELGWNKDVHPELLEAYMGETPENVVDLSQLLREISKQGSETSIDEEAITELSSVYKKASMLAHTIKGTSAVVGINAVANIGLPLEDILNYGTTHKLPQYLLEMLNESADLLESLYDSLLSEGTPPKEYPALYKKLCDWKQPLFLEESSLEQSSLEQAAKKDIVENETTTIIEEQTIQENFPLSSEAETKAEEKIESEESPEPRKKFTINLPPLEDILPIPKVATTTPKLTLPSIQRANLNETTLRVPVSVIDKLLSFSSELITANTQMSEQINTLLSERQSINERNDRIRHMLDELEWAVSQQSTAASKQTQSTEQSPTEHNNDHVQLDSLEMDSYNELHSVTSLLSESVEDDRKMSLSLVRQLNELKSQAYLQQQVNSELNSTVLNMRMESVKILAPRLQRIVRETCRQTKKQAELEIIGDQLALDTDIIKGLIDPLLHLLRNAVDHGIEATEVRQKKEKEAIGKIKLTFTQQGDQVALTLKDDGAGIDAEQIYQKAIKKGLIDNNATLSQEEKLRLILLAGFSTRDKVTETSGRGVGMDVVNLAVQNLSGDISIRSKKNKGSEIHIQVPLTLSVANVLLVDVLGNTLAIPNAFIQQIYHLSDNSIEEKEGKLFIYYQQQKLPLLALSTLLSWPASRFISDKSQSVLIVNHHNKRYALYADQILKPLNITIKTLKPWMTNVIGVNGVCLLPNGVVAPVLNLFDLLRTSVQNALDVPLNITDSATININQNKILVVDDSLSNRIALRLMLEALGHEVATAVDGADALQQIEKAPFKLVITDLEMPNMNGLEMVESLRVWAETKNLPIIMVTSRSTAKHRTLATEAGVNDYLTKPVDSNTLQATIEKYEMSDNIKEG